MKNGCIVGLLILTLSCKKDIVEDPLQLVTKGAIVASFNGRNWPDLSQNGAAVEVTYSRRRGYCSIDNQTIGNVNVRYQPKEGSRLYEEIGLRLQTPQLPLKAAIYSRTNGDALECLRLSNGDVIGNFSHTGFDGRDLISFSSYSLRTNRINQLIISRLDTIAKIVEGSFEANFIRQGSGNSTYPDTIQIKCSKFVAPMIN